MKTTHILAVLLMFISGLVVSCVPEPTLTRLDGFVVHSPQAGETLSVSTLASISGAFSVVDGLQLEDVHVWIVLEDNFGNHYLQNPPVELLADGTWKASNIRIESGIIKVLAVQVTDSGHRVFRDIVTSGNFVGFTELPEGSITLASVDIQAE